MEEFKFFEIINPINRFKLAKNIIIVGRPNVGKSTLFNRLVGKNLAIVSNETGVTRDIREFTISISKRKFLLFDTAGIDTLAKNNLSKDMSSNSIARAAMGDIILFVIDARNGVLRDDFEIAQTLRKQDRDVLLVLNKCENSVRSEVFSDSFSLEVPIQAISRGTLSNISSFQITQNNTSELTVVNIQSTTGGADAESDSVFRARIFSLFNGSNTGTALGFKNAALSVQGVIDALVVEPGNSLMLRDGSEVIKSEDGNLKILNSGSGGKVDIYILGSLLEEVTESFIFRDKSDDSNISDDKNDITLGYSNQDLTKTIMERRLLQMLPQTVSLVSLGGGDKETYLNNEGRIITGLQELTEEKEISALHVVIHPLIVINERILV